MLAIKYLLYYFQRIMTLGPAIELSPAGFVYRGVFYSIILLFFLCSCQKEFTAPFYRIVPLEVLPDVSAVVNTNGTQGDYDSISYHYLADRTYEIHHNYWGDSTVRTYYYDYRGNLSKIEDQKAIYFTNNDTARGIRFIYDNLGNLVETLTDFSVVTGVRAYYKSFITGNTKTIVVYDTSYSGPSYDLDWVNRVIYIVSSDNLVLYDSCIYFNYGYGHSKTVVSAYMYDGNSNATAINKLTYLDMTLVETGITNIIRDKPAPAFEALRKKLYRNLASWYQPGSAMQDDSYQLFPVPGTMFKSINYTGHSTTGGPPAEEVKRGYAYKNDYSNDLLVNSIVTYTMSGQGNTNYSFFIRYYYR